MKNYPSERTLRTKMNVSYIRFLDLLIRVPQVSTLDLLLFNIRLCDLFFFIEEKTVSSSAYDTTLFSNGTNVLRISNKEKSILTFLTGFRKTSLRQILTNRIFCSDPRNKLL